jgi:hypothetical protein
VIPPTRRRSFPAGSTAPARERLGEQCSFGSRIKIGSRVARMLGDLRLWRAAISMSKVRPNGDLLGF